MARFFSLLAGLLLALGLSAAHAASYQFTSPTYTGIVDFTAPCPGGTCANYTAGMRTTGWFTYLGSLPPNLVGHNLHADPNLMNYGFSDGLVTIEKYHAATRLGRFQVWTDAGGNITAYWVDVYQWVDAVEGPHANNDRINRINLSSTATSTNLHNYVCATPGATVPAGVADGCSVLGIGNPGFSSADHSNVGASWTSGIPTLSISSVIANEGNAGVTNFNFTVSLDAAPATPISVDWATTAVTANDPVDYTGNSGTLNWAAGDGSSRTITIAVNGDTAVEADETFQVRLTHPVGVGMNDPRGTGTIQNDDVAPASPVPTLSEWALTALAGLMALGALRWRRAARAGVR